MSIDGLLNTGPTCDHESVLVERQNPTGTAAWCGEWHDCPNCVFSLLIPSDDLTAFLREQQLAADGGQYRLALEV